MVARQSIARRSADRAAKALPGSLQNFTQVGKGRRQDRSFALFEGNMCRILATASNTQITAKITHLRDALPPLEAYGVFDAWMKKGNQVKKLALMRVAARLR
jgi:hypothetical protein